jgi:hypothetical protein
MPGVKTPSIIRALAFGGGARSSADLPDRLEAPGGNSRTLDGEA